ncbi:hypothetical protein [Microbacterium sp. Clip185]|uniref:hypothetical protein n=1 Tax=Microbacterium sp. Clip185 TaxID=3025663 RepID=UPI002366C6C7|nr:hypothetical protein [Microbacterium sp. Clip185]WDG18498.1 hypothetical protein PQV94_01855 [Microbacterium sp. Clip185]
MSEWEQRLRNLAEGPAWEMPNLSAVGPALTSLTTLMNRVASETGFTGETEREAIDQMQKAKADIEDLRRYVEQDLPTAINAANARREEAQRHLEALDSGSLSADAQQTIRNAAAGATIVFPGFSVIAGEGAIAAANWFLGSQREAQAKSAVEAVSNALDQDSGAFPELPPMENVYGSIPNIPDELRDTNIDTGGPSKPSFQNYPDYNTPIGVPPGQGGVIMPGPDGGDPRFVPNDPDGSGPNGTARPPIYNALPAPGVIVHPDGPVDGGVGNYPGGGLGTMPGGGSGGLGGSGSGGMGSGGLSSGFMAGAGGAAALGGLGKAAAAGGLGGLRGAGGLGGAGLAARGGAGGLGGGLTANAGGGAGGGLLGKGGAGGVGAGAGAAGEAAGGSRGATGMMGGGGAGAGAGGGGRSDKKGRGLGGPIAPSIEDDAEFGPRSEGAGAGGRD